MENPFYLEYNSIMLKDKLQADLKEAMLARDAVKTSVIRMIKSAVTYFEIQKGGAGYEATDEEVLQVINQQAKQRKDSIEQFTAANRMELVEKEQQELELLQTYLPKQLSEEEVKVLVNEAITQTGAKTIQDLLS